MPQVFLHIRCWWPVAFELVEGCCGKILGVLSSPILNWNGKTTLRSDLVCCVNIYSIATAIRIARILVRLIILSDAQTWRLRQWEGQKTISVFINRVNKINLSKHKINAKLSSTSPLVNKSKWIHPGEEAITVEALLATTLASDQLLLRPPLWNSVWIVR